MTSPTHRELPPLPKPCTLSRGDEDGAIQLGYTADQMHAYARSAVAAALEQQAVPQASEPAQAEAPSEREAFELHVNEGGKFPGCSHRDENGNYTNPFTQPARRAWLAALRYAALAIHTEQAAKPEFVGWYCAHCRRGVDASEVTFREQHQVCGRVITNDRPPSPEQAADREDSKLLDWLVEQQVDTIYLDDGRIIDVGTGRIGAKDHTVSPHDVRAAIRAALARGEKA